MLSLDTTALAAPITGLVSDGNTTMALNAWPAIKFSRAALAPQAGRYTAVMEPAEETDTPFGYSTGHLTIGKTGAAVLALRLANGQAISLGSAITAGNRIPLYAIMDGGHSSISSPLEFADKPDSDLDGLAFWSSARVRSSKYSFDPFVSETRLFGQFYKPPTANARALLSLDAVGGAAVLTFDDGTALLTQNITLGTNQKVTPGNPLLESFKMSITAKTGNFDGSFILPVTRKSVGFGGVLLQKSGEGLGRRLSGSGEMKVALAAPIP